MKGIPRPRLVKLGLLALLAVVTFALIVRIALTATLTGSPCGAVPPTRGAIDPNLLALVGVAAFVGGGIFSATRAAGPPPAASANVPTGDLAVHALLALFLLLTTGALVYETYALLTPGVWPITFYVRCANYVDPFWTLLGLAASATLLGHWLWRPVRRD